MIYIAHSAITSKSTTLFNFARWHRVKESVFFYNIWLIKNRNRRKNNVQFCVRDYKTFIAKARESAFSSLYHYETGWLLQLRNRRRVKKMLFQDVIIINLNKTFTTGFNLCVSHNKKKLAPSFISDFKQKIAFINLLSIFK